jgi:hypothetical protein
MLGCIINIVISWDGNTLACKLALAFEVLTAVHGHSTFLALFVRFCLRKAVPRYAARV